MGEHFPGTALSDGRPGHIWHSGASRSRAAPLARRPRHPTPGARATPRPVPRHTHARCRATRARRRVAQRRIPTIASKFRPRQWQNFSWQRRQYNRLAMSFSGACEP